MTRTLGRLALCGAAIVSSASFSNVFDSYGTSAANIAVGNANTASSDGAFAAYSNPALLTQNSKHEISLSSMQNSFHLQDLPRGENGKLPLGQDRSSKADALMGAAFGLHLKLQEKLHFGLASYLPQGSLGKVRGLSPYEATYLRYAENQQKPAIYTALAYALPQGFSLALGAYYSLKAKGLLQLAIDSQESEGRLQFVLEPVIVPYAGFAWQGESLAFGALYRAAQETESTIDASFAFSTNNASLPFDATTSLIPFYDPEILRLGTSYQWQNAKMMASLEQARWSNFVAPLLTITGSDVAALSQENRATNAKLRDTYAYRVGYQRLLWQGESRIDGSLGFESHSSANKPGESSYVVDPARQSLAIGSSLSFAPDELGRLLRLDFAYQYSVLEGISMTTPKGLAVRLDRSSRIQTLVGGLRYEL